MDFLVSVILAILRKNPLSKTESNKHAKRNWKRHGRRFSLSNTVLALSLAFLFIPLFVIVFYSFNESKSSNFTRFSLVWYEELFFHSGRLWLALFYSMVVAVVSAVISTILGSLAAIGNSWYKFFGRSYIQSVSFLPMVLPEVIMGVSLLIFLSGVHMNLGLGTISARVDEFDYSIIEAAHDLGANEKQTLFKVIIPAIMPGIMSGFMMSITMSIEDFVITSLVNGHVETLPIYVYNMIRHGVSPVINALSFVLILIICLLAGLLRKSLKGFAAAH